MVPVSAPSHRRTRRPPGARRPSIRRLAAALAVVCLIGAAPAGALDWSIRDYDVRIRVAADGELTISERIEVDFESPRHGIYRVIPVRETTRAGLTRDLRFEFDAAVDPAGRALSTQVKREGARVRIRIGDADRTVSGVQTYVLRYRVRRVVDFYDDHDELYWNVTGNEWAVPIGAARVRVELPETLPEERVSLAVYTGAAGAREEDATARYTPGVLEVETTRPLAEWSGLTFALGWPKGIVEPPSAASRVADVLRANAPLLLPLPVGWWVWRRWRTRGRDPRTGRVVTVQYEPPPGLGPAHVGTLVDERVDMRDLTADVVDLAVRGHLRIETDESRLLGIFPRQEFALLRLQAPEGAAPLSAHESELLAGLFERGERVELSDLRQRFYKHLPAIRRGVYDELVAAGLFEASPESVRNRWLGLGVVWLVAGGLLSVAWARWQGLSTPLAILPALFGVGLSGAILLVAAHAMPRRTRKGVELTLWARGLEEFVNRVESPRLELEERAGLDPRAHFERVLPYAMALGVASRWAEVFEGIYTTPPSWYQGPAGAHFSSRSFVGGLESMRGTMATSMTAAPRSSGGSGLGGGGFSGGGHGGGGGGAW